MKFQLSTLLIIFALAFTFSVTKVYAGLPIISCDSCSASQMKLQAEQNIVSVGRSNVVVFDYRNEIARKFEVNYQLERGKPIVTATPINFTSEEQHDVNLYFEYRNALVDILRAGEKKVPYSIYEGGPSSTITSLPKNSTLTEKESAQAQSSQADNNYSTGGLNILGSPYDYLQTPSIRNDIYDHYMSGGQGTSTSIITQTLQKPDVPTFKISNKPLQLNFFKLNNNGVLEPNGHVIVEINTALERLETLAARDGDNNSIPITRAAALGEVFRFTDATRGKAFKNFIRVKYTPMTCKLTPSVSTAKSIVYYQCS